MNREIRFRGKRLDNGEWVYGNLVEITKDNVFAGDVKEAYRDRTYIISQMDVNIVEEGYSDAGMESLSFHYDEIDPSTVGQYTGLKDKNGKEIFEGDICNQDDFGKGAVKWKDYGWCFEPELEEDMIIDVVQQSEIIGNIHHNKTL